MLDQDFGWAPPLPAASLVGQTITISVTTEDIQLGDRSDNSQCPIALAIKRARPGCGVRVGATSAEIFFPRKSVPVGYWLPPIATNFIRNFDHHLLVAPFNCKLIARGCGR